MSHLGFDAALLLCLAAGAADLLALNVVVLPATRAPIAQRLAPDNAPREPRALPSAHAQQAGLLPVPFSAGPAPKPEPLAILEFEPASLFLDVRAAQALSALSARLREAPEITVIGHADASGPEQLNDRLSAQRAALVARRLLGSGILPARVRVAARGEHEPRAEGNSRRVEIFVGGAP